jgi:glycolate oxidase
MNFLSDFYAKKIGMKTIDDAINIIEENINDFKKICGGENVIIDPEEMHRYGHDETESLNYLPGVVLKPRTANEISQIVVICNEFKIPVTPRGAGTGLSGGALPHLGGVVISTERMNSILDID